MMLGSNVVEFTVLVAVTAGVPGIVVVVVTSLSTVTAGVPGIVVVVVTGISGPEGLVGSGTKVVDVTVWGGTAGVMMSVTVLLVVVVRVGPGPLMLDRERWSPPPD